MRRTLRQLWQLLTPKERRRAVTLLAILMAVALTEALGVASIMPFIAVLSRPDILESNAVLAAVYSLLGLESRRQFQILLGVFVFLLLMASLGLKAAGLWAQLRFTQNRSHEWASRLVAGYLNQPYEWFIDRHSADLSTSILAEVNQVVNGSLMPVLKFIAHAMIVIFLSLLLVVVDPLLATIASVVIGGLYLGVLRGFQNRLTQIGAERKAANRKRFHVVQEALGGIKEVKVTHLEAVFNANFRKASRRMADRQVSAGLIGELPSVVMQAALFGGMLLLLLYLIASRGGFAEALPLIALYAFAGYRLLPALQTVYQQVTQTRVSAAALDALSDDLANLNWTNADSPAEDAPQPLQLRSALELRAVSYTYPGAIQPTLHDLNLEVRARTTIGLVGATGSGKTTTVDLLLGLLRPSSGKLIVDGRPLEDGDVHAWQLSLGYVPQHIFLADTTLAGNIAFGVPEQRIDWQRVEIAARAARLHDFVAGELPDGYQTAVGERGVRLSGGQRQRVGIARALYRNPDLLILDEATSALDNATERAVMDAIHGLSGTKTIILIAHRLTTLESCDRVYFLESGSIGGSGTFAELISSHAGFRALAGLDHPARSPVAASS